jgi:hypothetical protein
MCQSTEESMVLAYLLANVRKSLEQRIPTVSYFLPVKHFAAALVGAAAKFCATCRIAQKHGHGVGEAGDILWIDQDSRVS